MLPYGSLHWSLLPVKDHTRIPNLLYQVYKSRPDLQQAFPRPFGMDERKLLSWAQNHLATEYDIGDDLSSQFRLPDEILNAFKSSSHRTVPNGFFKWALTPVTNTTRMPTLIYEIWKTRVDLQLHFPDPLGYDQPNLLTWAQYHLAREYFSGDNFLGRFKRNPGIISSNLRKGINIVGYVRGEMGVGESSRMAARALQTTNIPFGMINFTVGSPSRMRDSSWKHKEIETPEYLVNIFHINADGLKVAYNTLGWSFFSGHYNIGYWHWELPDFPDEWCGSFNLVEEVWVASNFVLDSVSRKSPVPVHRIPPGIQVVCRPDTDRSYFGLPTDRFLFLSMYDIFSYRQRKNPKGVIDAFHQAFGNNSAVGLVLKINNAYSNPEEVEEVKALKRYVQGLENIYIINRTLDRDEVNALIQSVDCFVSLHRSEGFGLVMAEAMYLGKPVIGTNWSGNTDFMHAMNSCPVNYEIVNVGANYPYGASQVWAEPDVEHAAHFMRKLVSDKAWYDIIAHKGQETILKEFSPSAVGTMIKQRLQILRLV